MSNIEVVIIYHIACYKDLFLIFLKYLVVNSNNITYLKESKQYCKSVKIITEQFFGQVIKMTNIIISLVQINESQSKTLVLN